MRLLFALFLCLVMSSSIVWADAQQNFQKGVKAYEQKDYATALKWFKPLAEQGDMAAQFNVGLMYELGLGVKKDQTKKVKWFTKAANQREMKAQRKLGFIYFTGDGVKKDRTKALKWSMKAAKQGDAESQFILSRLYIEGGNSIESAKWLNRAAKQGKSEAQSILGVIHFYGSEGIKQDFAISFTWLILAAEQGNSKAIKALKDLHKYAFKPSPASPNYRSSSYDRKKYFACIDTCEADVKAQSNIACKSLSSTDGSALGGYQTSSQSKCYDSFTSPRLACSTKCLP